MRTARPRNTDQQLARGFTLVEMLVVVGIIVILVTLLVPSVAAVRKIGQATATKVLLHTLETGLNMFKGEIRLGRDYPPSYGIPDPDNTLPAPFNVQGDYFYGAQTLVWALAGPNLQGTYGFSGNVLPATGTPRGPFVDVGKIKMKRASDVIGGVPQGCEDAGWNAPVFVDDFDWPILYFKANNRSYDLNHNIGFFYANGSALPLGQGKNFYNPGPGPGSPGGYILDTTARNLGTIAPCNADSFLLISVGPDKKYGTADDVANFVPNVQ